MKYIIVSVELVGEQNKRMCLSPIRATNRCIACKSYDVCESRRVNKKVHDKRNRILKKMNKAKKQLDKFQKEFLAI